MAGRKKHGKKATVPRQIVAEPEPPPVGGPELKRERERKAGALSLFRASAERPSSDESDGSPPFKSPRGSEADSMAEDEGLFRPILRIWQRLLSGGPTPPGAETGEWGCGVGAVPASLE